MTISKPQPDNFSLRSTFWSVITPGSHWILRELLAEQIYNLHSLENKNGATIKLECNMILYVKKSSRKFLIISFVPDHVTLCVFEDHADKVKEYFHLG